MSRRTLVTQLAGFGMVGVSAACAYFCVNWLLVDAMRLHAQVANVAAFVVAATISYLGHHTLTFQAKGRHGEYTPRFIVQSIAGLVLTALVTKAAQVWGVHHLIATAINVVVMATASFLTLKLWVFSRALRRE